MVDGRLAVSYLSAEDRPMFAIRNGDGTWERIDLLDEAGGPGVAGRVVTWSDSRDGSTYAAARSDAGLILYERRANGTWSVRNLSTELNKPRIVGELTVYVENNGRAHIAGLNAAGKLIDFKMKPGRKNNGDWKWGFLNVQNHLNFRGRVAPEMAGQLDSFVTPNNSWNVVGLDTSGAIQLFFKEAGRRWDVVNLSAFAGTPMLTGSLSVYQGTERSIGITGIAPNGNVWVTGFTESGGWQASNASQGKRAPQKFRGGGLTTYVDAGGVAYLAGLNGAGKVVVYRYNANNGKWASSIASNQVGAEAPRLAGAMTATMSADGVGVSVVGQTAEGRIIRYSWRAGEAWQAEDVSERLAA